MALFDDSALQRTLGDMLRRAQTPEKPLKEIGFLMVNEMKQNIEVGGRPTPWKKSGRAERQGGQTLRDSGTLMNSETSEVQGNSVAAGPTAVGRKKLNDPRILAILAFGGTIKAKNKPFLRFRAPGGGWVKKKEVTMPGRDYTYMPPETRVTFGDIVQRFMLGQ